MKSIGLIGVVCMLCCSCHPSSSLLEPNIKYTPQERQFRKFPSAFNELSTTELEQEWGKELMIGINFARELDLYRAITAFKRSLFLIPPHEIVRRNQIHFYLVQSYYLGSKYPEAIHAFESSPLSSVSSDFPPFRELVIILYDSYLQNKQCENAERILELLEKGDPQSAQNLKLYNVIEAGDMGCIKPLAENHPQQTTFDNFVYCACHDFKSARKAQMLNAILPGAGYYYTGQKKSALTSFLINTSFIAASWYFWDRGNYGAAFITTSLEFGWYVGGINGAGLAAKEWNQHIYNTRGKELMIKQNLFPVLMLETSF